MANIVGTDLDDTLVGGVENDSIQGLSGDDSLDGGSGNDSLLGGAGTFDLLIGSSGDDLLDGGDGDADVADYRGAPQPVTVDLGAGTASGWGNDILAAIEVAFGSAHADLIIGNAEANVLFGSGSNDHLQGRGGNDILRGDTGNDTLDGGDAGFDIVEFGNAPGPVAVYLDAGVASGDGSDVLIGVEAAYLSDFDDVAIGSSTSNELRGRAGNDYLRGLGGDDWLRGGSGNDTLDGGDGLFDMAEFNDSGVAVAVDLAAGTASGEGSDVLEGIEGASLSAFDDVAHGSLANNLLFGNAGNDSLNGGANNDKLRGDAGNDTVDGGDGQDIAYFSGNFADYRFEFGTGFIVVADQRAGVNDGIDTLRGVEILRFADSIATVSDLESTDDIINMIGPGGSSFSGGVDNDTYIVDDPLDNPLEAPGEGIDTVRSGIAWTLGDNLENLVLTGTAAIGGTGNAANNTLIGNEAANSLQGAAGKDTLDGGAGADTLTGGVGNDTYLVGAGDRITELSGGGTDTAQAGINWTLGANIEKLLLTGSGAIAGTGNTAANTITGNAAANKLSGGGGADRLFGQAGNDVLLGGTGKDQLTGGLGNDAFVFGSKLSAVSNIDVIKDFVSGQDKIRLDDDVFKAFSFAVDKGLKPAQFHADAGAVTAHDADDRIIHNTTTGALYYDADGAGGVDAIQFATLGTTTHPTISAADFAIVA